MSRLGWLPFLFLECQEPKSADYTPPSLVVKTQRCRGGWWLLPRGAAPQVARQAIKLRLGAGGWFVVGVWFFLVPTHVRGLRRPAFA